MKNFLYVLLVLCFWHWSASTRTLDHFTDRELRAFIALLEEDYSVQFTASHLTPPKDHTIDGALDDEVNIDLWNELNDRDIKNMPTTEDYSDEVAAARWLKWYLTVSLRYRQIGAILSWNYETNITVENSKKLTSQSLRQAPLSRLTLPIAKKFNAYIQKSKNADLKLIFGRLSTGTVSHDDKDVKRASQLHSQLESIYGTTTVCELNDTKQCHTIEPYLQELMQTEKDYDRLTWAWKGWHDGCGNKVRPVYLEYIDLLNKNDKANGYTDLAQEWIEDYEMGNATEFEGILDQLLKDVMPLYEQLHAYVRGRLCSIYPKRFSCSGPIPGQLLGNMWAQTWNERFSDLIAFPDAPLIDITKMLHDKHVSVHQMYTTAEKFFTSIGLYPMTPKFWARSMFKKPKDRDVVCHASASDFSYHDDYRVKICTEINEDYFYTIHHEMGHIEYYMAYAKGQPFVYRDGANSAFHEAIGDTIGMYAISPAHLIKLGFLDEEAANEHFQLNYLLRLALQKVAFLPFAYTLDKYRFALFRNEIDREHALNSMWWAMRIEHGGVMAAVPRTDKVNFDPGAKYHVPSNVPYARYFIAHILQFQFYRALCQIKGQTKNLHMCDIYGNREAGAKFREMLAMGSSKLWPEVLERLTGERKLDSKAILDFFEPLHKWLKAENLARGYPVGWM